MPARPGFPGGPGGPGGSGGPGGPGGPSAPGGVGKPEGPTNESSYQPGFSEGLCTRLIFTPNITCILYIPIYFLIII